MIERDFGYDWTVTGFPRYRVSWVETTGELYALNLSSGQRIPLAVMDRDALDLLMAEWPEAMHQANSLGILRASLEQTPASEVEPERFVHTAEAR